MELPPHWFDRVDNENDAAFYAAPRWVAHIDEATIAALCDYYREELAPGADLLDLMSSWISHLPQGVAYGRVAGVGMNAEELARNPQLGEWSVRDLNRDPCLPYADGEFDAVLNAVSVQYLVRPVEVFREVARVLRPGGRSIVAMSHRCFPTKAIRAFHGANGSRRLELVSRYYACAGGFSEIECLDRSPRRGDPLWICAATKT